MNKHRLFIAVFASGFLVWLAAVEAATKTYLEDVTPFIHGPQFIAIQAAMPEFHRLQTGIKTETAIFSVTQTETAYEVTMQDEEAPAILGGAEFPAYLVVLSKRDLSILKSGRDTGR